MHQIRELPHVAVRHFVALLEAGKHFNIHHVEAPALDQLTRSITRFLKQRMGTSPRFHLFWFAVDDGFYVAISSTMGVRRLIPEFYENGIKRGYIQAADQIYVGASKETLATKIPALLAEHRNVTGKRSIGGTIVSPEADLKAAQLLAGAA